LSGFAGGHFRNELGVRNNDSQLATGRPDEFVKKSPKMQPNPFFDKLNISLLPWKEVAPKFCTTSVILETLPKVNHRPIGKNSPNLVILVGNHCNAPLAQVNMY
jgi:hypothetical protein